MYPEFPIEQLAIFNLYGKNIDEIGSNIKVLNKEEIIDNTDRFYQHLIDYTLGNKEQ